MNAYEHELAPVEEPTGLPLWGILRRRFAIILFCLVVGLGLAYLQHIQKPTFYRSEAQIWVAKRTPPPLANLEQQSHFMDDQANMQTQELLLKSPLVIQDALKKPQMEPIRTRLGREPLAAISKNLTITEAGTRSNVLALNYLSAHRGDSQNILDAVISSYQDYLGDTQQDVGEETRRLITEAKDELLQQISVKEAKYREFKQTAPLLWVKEKGQNYFQERLQGIENDRSSLLVERKKLEAQLQSIQEAIERGDSRGSIMLMAGESLDKASLANENFSPLQQLLPLYVERQDLMQDYGPDHPKVIAVNKRIELTRSFLQEMNVGIGSDDTDPTAAPEDFLDVYVTFLEGQLRQNTLREQLLNELFEEVQTQAKSLSQFEAQDETFRSEIGRLRQLFETVVKRVEELSLIKDVGGYKVSVLHPPTPDSPTQLNLANSLILGSIIGLVAGLVLAYLVDTASKTFYSAEEISQSLRLPLIGHLPLISAADRRKAASRSDLDPMLYTHAIPRSSASEAYRAVRTALYFTSEGKDHRVVQITSPTPGDGKTTLAGNLAVTIAQSGKRTLLLDADFRKPRIHRLFQLSSDVGLASVIDGRTEVDEAIQATAVDNLSVMACGPRPSNPSELLSSPQFRELLDVLREKYDYVLIDTPPLLAVTDPSTVAPRVDSVILTIRLQKGVRPNAERSAEMLRSMGANLLGIVVNGVGKGRGYRHYSSGYNHYGGYRGGYGGGYTDSYDADGYYDEEDPPQAQPESTNHQAREPVKNLRR